MTIDDYLSKIKEILKDNKQFSDHNLNIFEELFEPAYPDDYGFSEYNIEYDFQFTCEKSMFKKKTFHISFEDEEHAFTSDVLIHEVVFSYSFKLDIKGELEWLSERDIDIIEEKYIYSDILPERFYPVVKECIESFIILNKDEEETERLIAEYGELDIKDINVRNIINKLMNDITK